MASSYLPFLKISVIILILVIRAEAKDYLYSKCYITGNYSANSTYGINLNRLLASLSSDDKIDYGFYNFTVGESTDKANAIALCRGDKDLNACRSCVNASRYELPLLCPNQIEAIIFYDNCMLRYSNRSIFNTNDNGISYYKWNNREASDLDQFNQALDDLLSNLTKEAGSGNSTRKFAVAESDAINFQTLYALVQCTPDLTELQCINCLETAIAQIPERMSGKVGGRVYMPSCNLRYEIYKFYDSAEVVVPPPSLPESSPPPPTMRSSNDSSSSVGGKKSKKSQIVVIAVLTVVALIVIASVCVILGVRRPWKKLKHDSDHEIESADSLQFDFSTIRIATNDFSATNKLGEGGFGDVYKGRLLDGQEIAVKRLSKDSQQGDTEFKNELLLMSKLHHKNLVRLLGFCLAGTERLLIYELLPNSSLEKFIFDPIKSAHLNWNQRYIIIKGIARGLLYLHQDSRYLIIHRDLKASNILLDHEMNPKIADFGLARLFQLDKSETNTSQVAGTMGYMAPEYANYGQISVKMDVYSFGVLVLEIVSGRKNKRFTDGGNVELLVAYAWEQWRAGTVADMIDPELSVRATSDIIRCVHIGLLCVQENVADRPTMVLIDHFLNNRSFTLQIPSRPAYLRHGRTTTEMSRVQGQNSEEPVLNQSKDKPADFSINNVSITELHPR